MWQASLRKAGYVESRYFISREAADITKYLIEGVLGLIVVHRDLYACDKAFPLLMWHHGTDPCEHSFGCFRSIVVDFTLLEFYHMTQKTRVRMHEAVLLAESSANPKARAVGYNHTYMDHTGIDIQELARYPSDKEIAAIAHVAFAEAEALVALLGVVPAQLHRDDPDLITLPGIRSFLSKSNGLDMDEVDMEEETEEDLDPELEEEEEEEEELECATTLQRLILEDHWQDLPREAEDKLLKISLATASLAIDDMVNV